VPLGGAGPGPLGGAGPLPLRGAGPATRSGAGRRRAGPPILPWPADLRPFGPPYDLSDLL